VSLNVLVTAGSRRVPLVQAFQRAVRAAGGGSVIVTDINPLSPTVYVADRSYGVPMSNDRTYLDAIADICRTESIALVVPTIDDELTLFAENTARFADLGIRVAVSPPTTTVVCNDKYSACRVLNEWGISAAETYLPAELPADPAFPLFIKPRYGRGGAAAFPVCDSHELEFFLTYVPDPVVQTYLAGPEFTIDVLCDFNGEPLSIVPCERVVVRAGVVDRRRTVRHPKLIELGLACARALRFVGAINIQCRMVDDRPVIFEINPRFSGGIPLTIAAGADFPRLLIDVVRGRRVAPAIGRFQEHLWMSSYEMSVFVPDAAVGFTAASACRSIPEVA